MAWINTFITNLMSFIPRLTTLEPWESGLITTLGKYVRQVDPGWYIVWPCIQECHYMEVQPQTVDLRVQSVWTKDGRDIAVSGAVKYRITDVKKAFMNIQEVDKAIQIVSLAIIAEFLNARDKEACHDIVDLKGEILKGLREEAQGWGIKVERVYITDIGNTRNLRLLHHNEAGNGETETD